MNRTWLILALALVVGVCEAATVTVAWDPPIPSNNVAGYKVYWGPASRGYTNSVNTRMNRTGSVPGLDATRSHYFAVTAYDARTNESDYSVELVWDNSGPVIRWNIARIEIGYSPWKIFVPDLRPFVTVSDNFTTSWAGRVTQTPAPGSLVTVSPFPITITAIDEAGNSASITTNGSVSASFKSIPVGPRFAGGDNP